MMQTSSWPFNCSKKEYCVSRMEKALSLKYRQGQFSLMNMTLK